MAEWSWPFYGYIISLRQKAIYKEIGKCSNVDLMVNLFTAQPLQVMFSIIMLMLCKTHYNLFKLNLVLYKHKTENCLISDYFFGFSLNHN